jgi:uncharacterized protein
VSSGHGLSPQTIAHVTRVLASFPGIEKAVLFGSRAKGTHKPGSDIDLALAGENLDWRTLGRISSALDDLPVPYRFSLVALGDKLDAALAAHIDRVGVQFFERSRRLGRTS